MRYLVLALVVSLCWLHQDWFVWPLLAEFNDQDNFLAWLYVQEHELKMGIPAGFGFQIALSFAIAGVWWLAVWKAWPTELEEWAETGSRSGNDRRSRSRGGRRGGRDNRDRGERRDSRDKRDSREEKKSSGQRSEERKSGEGGSRRRRSRGGRGRRGGTRGGESS